MHIAARQGDLKLMKTYVEQGAELETKDDTGVILSSILRVFFFCLVQLPLFSSHKSFGVRQGEPENSTGKDHYFSFELTFYLGTKESSLQSLFMFNHRLHCFTHNNENCLLHRVVLFSLSSKHSILITKSGNVTQIEITP